MEVNLDNKFILGVSVFLCPSCGGDHMHHKEIEVFERFEDEENGIHVTVHHDNNKNVSIDSDCSENPSSRRHGITITFWCEECQKISKMHIKQHKGFTFFEIEHTENKQKFYSEF